MKVRKTNFSGLYEIETPAFGDDRGRFTEIYNSEKLREGGIDETFVQDNVSWSTRGVVRGIHFQKAPYGQVKLVRVLRGSVLDIAVDLRKDSPTFGQVFSQILDDKKNNALLIPAGFAHGFSALEDCIFHYKCSQLYHREAEQGIIWNDPELNIDWKVDQPLVSEKDKKLPTFKRFIDQINESL